MIILSTSEGQTEVGHVLTALIVCPGGSLMSWVDRACPAAEELPRRVMGWGGHWKNVAGGNGRDTEWWVAGPSLRICRYCCI